MAINHLIRASLMCQRERGRYAYISPTYRQGKAVAWDYLKHYSDPIPGRSFNESELRVDMPNGAQIRLYGADNPDALRGIYLDGVVLDEYGLMQGKVWSEVLRPALADRRGLVSGRVQGEYIARPAQRRVDRRPRHHVGGRVRAGVRVLVRGERARGDLRYRAIADARPGPGGPGGL
jgi:hypothetical protein